MNYSRQITGIIGLLIGVVIYQGASRLPQPWESILLGLCFVAMGAGAWWYAAGERWIQVLAAVLITYGVIRMFL